MITERKKSALRRTYLYYLSRRKPAVWRSMSRLRPALGAGVTNSG